MRIRKTRSSRRRGGFTLIEVSITALVLAVMMTGVGMLSKTSESAYTSTILTASIDVRARRALTRIGSELAPIGGTWLVPGPGELDPATPFGAGTIQYRQAIGVVNGVPAWGPNTQLGFEYAPGEADDGLDNDGDGVVDNGALVLTLNFGAANAQRVVLCNGVRELGDGEITNGVDDNGNGVSDESGVSFQRLGDVMTVRLCLEQRAPGGGTIVRTHQTSIRIRNIDL